MFGQACRRILMMDRSSQTPIDGWMDGQVGGVERQAGRQAGMMVLLLLLTISSDACGVREGGGTCSGSPGTRLRKACRSSSLRKGRHQHPSIEPPGGCCSVGPSPSSNSKSTHTLHPHARHRHDHA